MTPLKRYGPVYPAHPDLIAAMRASAITAPQDRGVWYIERREIPPVTRHLGAFTWYPQVEPVMTSLCRWTDATVHLGHGEAVMSDDPRELRRHLPVVLAASGRVLVTGLGLGCVVRGLLARPAVTHVDVVEIDADVLAMVAPSFVGEPRVTLHHGDALTYDWPRGTRWDYGWHDVWSEDPDTQVIHAHLLRQYRGLVARQGAWGFTRWMKRLWPWPLLGAGAERRIA